MVDRTEEVLALAAEVVSTRAPTEGLRRLLETALVGLREQARTSEVPAPFIHLPLLVYGGVRGETEPALPLAVVTTLLFLGLDILDDLADGDRPEHWGDHRAAEIHLAAATLLCALPQLLLSDLDAAPAVRDRMQRTLAEGLLRMSAGQQQDLARVDAVAVTPDEVRASVEAKSGEELALFAAMAAQLAEAPAEVVERYAAMARALGTAGQLSSDCYELFQDPACRDLVHGARPLPVALHLERVSGEERNSFLRLLDQARQPGNAGEAARESVRKRLREAGDLRRAAFVVEVHVQRALRLLEEAAPQEPARSGLRAIIALISFFGREAPGGAERQRF